MISIEEFMDAAHKELKETNIFESTYMARWAYDYLAAQQGVAVGVSDDFSDEALSEKAVGFLGDRNTGEIYGFRVGYKAALQTQKTIPLSVLEEVLNDLKKCTTSDLQLSDVRMSMLELCKKELQTRRNITIEAIAKIKAALSPMKEETE